MERERGRKSYFVHNMRQDVAILCSKSNTNSDKACFGPAPGGRKISIRRTGAMPLMISTRENIYSEFNIAIALPRGDIKNNVFYTTGTKVVF